MTSRSRSGKRPRNAGMEGSTIVVPNNNNGGHGGSNSNNAQGKGESLILMLAKSCTRHNEQHKKDGDIDEICYHQHDGEDEPACCRKALLTLSRIIPKVEKAYRASSNPNAIDVRHLCDFYLGVVQRSFCPSALKLFEYGKNPADILSRVILLLEHILSTNNRSQFKSQWRRVSLDASKPLWNILCNTAASLLGVLSDPKLHACIFADLIHTIYDLSILMTNGGYFNDDAAEPVDVLLFTATLGSTELSESEMVLRVDSLDATKLLQAALLNILLQWVKLVRVKRLDSFPDPFQSHTIPDAAFGAILWSNGKLDMASETMTELYSTVVNMIQMPMESKCDFRDGLGRFAALGIVQALLQDFQNVGAPDLHSVVDLSGLIVQTALNVLKVGQESKVLDALAECIQTCISNPPRINGWSLAASQLATWRVACPVLLECVPILPEVGTPSTKKLGNAILSALGKAFDHYRTSGVLSLSQYARAVDADFLEALFLLVQDIELAQQAVWLCALAVDCSQETFGELDAESVVKSIFEKFEQFKDASGTEIMALGEESRKRSRPERGTRPGGSPEKRARVQKNEYVEVAQHRLDLLRGCIVDLVAAVLVASDDVSQSETIDSLLAEGIVKISGVANIIALSRSLGTGDVFGVVMDRLVVSLNGVFHSMASINGSDWQPSHKQAVLVSLEMLAHTRGKTNLPSGVHSQRLLEFANRFALLVDNEKVVQSVASFPLVDESHQTCRIQLLRHRLKTSVGRLDAPLGLIETTLESLRGAFFEHEDSLVRLLYWQIAAWLLVTSSDIERHLNIVGDNHDFAASKLVKFLVSTPFSDQDDTVRAYAAGKIGELLVSNPSVRAFLTDTVNKGRGIDGPNQGAPLNLAEGLEETRLFKDIDSLLHKYCRIPQSQLSFTVGLSLGSRSDDGKARMRESIGFHRSGICSLMSLLETFLRTTDARGDVIAKNAFLRVVRLWVFFAQNEVDESASFTLGELTRVLSRCRLSSRRPFLQKVAPATFRDVLFPSSAYFTSPDQGNTNPFFEQLENQCRMLYVLTEKFLTIGDLADFPLFGGVAASSVQESLDGFLPNAIAQLVMEKDYDVLRSLTAFSRYVLNRRREAKKGKRAAVTAVESDHVLGASKSKSKLWACDLEVQTMQLCSASDVIERLLPLLLMHAGPEEDRFFTKRVLLNKLSLPKMIETRGQLVLKGLVKEFGESDEVPRLAVWALKKAAVARGLSQEETSLTGSSANSNDSNNESVRSWISENFMHLLVNLVQSRWREKSLGDRIRALRCLRAMLGFLRTTGSAQFVPQIMSTVNASLGDSEDDELDSESTEIRYLAVQILDLLVRLVWEDSWETVGKNLTSFVVALIPVLSEREPQKSTQTAVALLKWLTQADRGSRLAPFFKNIPFLPSTPALDPVKSSLAEIGIDFDDLRLTMTEGSMSRFSTQSDMASISGDSKSVEQFGRMKAHMETRLKTVCSLLENENSSVRLNALKHLISLLQFNRGIFYALVDTEETSSMSRFLTVCKDETVSHGRGVIGSLVETLLKRSALETNKNVRVLVAKAFGEVGAITERRLFSHGSNDVVSSETDPTFTWRLDRPPWKSTPADYQESLLIDHLVSALKAAPTSLDHQKIAFTIQEVLALARVAVVDVADVAGRPVGNNTDDNTSTSSAMPNWLSDKLEKAGVLQIVEPFLNSEYRERETSNPSPPPFFSSARSYYEWLSNWLRYMIHQSRFRRESHWCGLLHACRFALRTQVGLKIAEFLLPIVVLDRICFGNLQDEECVLKEIFDVFSFGQAEKGSTVTIRHEERQKAVGAVFSVIDTLRYWSERDIEDRHQNSSLTKDSRVPKDRAAWTADESIMRIEDILKAVPLALQAKAAAQTGMYARSLRLLEMASRNSVVEHVFNESSPRDYVIPTRSISSGGCPDDSVDLLKDNLAILGEYETIAVLSEEDLSVNAMSKALDGIRQKESSKDWSGALQDYERAHHLVSNPEQGKKLMEGTLSCLLELGQFESVLRQVKGSSFSSLGEQADSLVPFAVEASWRLGRWDILSELVDDTNSNTLPPGGNAQFEVGRAMLAIHQNDAPLAMDAIDSARDAVMGLVSAAAKESYSRTYPHIIKLHTLREMEDAVPIICDNAAESDLATYVSAGGGFWKRRLESVDPSCTMTLCQSRLALARLAKKPGLEASLFLAIGRRARKDQQHSIAASALAQAEASFALVKDDQSLDAERSELILQLAKLKHETGDSSSALRLLNMDDIELMSELDKAHFENETLRRVSTMLRKKNHGMSEESAVEVFRKGALMSTKWMIEGGMKDCTGVVQRFRTIHRVAPTWEKGHFQFAKYVESMLCARVEGLHRRARGQVQAAADEDSFRQTCLSQERLCQKYLALAMKHFIEALSLDTKHLFQALPRLLSLWFEFSALSIDTNNCEPMSQENLKKLKESLKIKQGELNELVASKHRTIPAHAFYSALPQLTSRIADSNDDLSLVVQRILSRVLAKFPGQAMWPLAWLLRSKDAKRKKVGQEVFKEAENTLKTNRSDGQLKLLVASKGLFAFLEQLAVFKAGEGKKTLSFKLWRGEVPLSDFIPPIQAALSPTFTPLGSGGSRDAFPHQFPRMKEFSKTVSVMMSKARPKRLKAYAVAIQSNPRVKQSRAVDVGEFHFLIKQEAKGDLRKDARVQDLNNVINRLFMSPNGKGGTARHLRLRTFTVTCLSEETGILEWVPQTNSLRNLVSESYNPQASAFSAKRRGKRLANAADPMMRANFEKKCQDMFFSSGDLKKAARLFRDLMLKSNPPVLFWWFCQKFMDPHRWYEARTRFTLSAAAWSAVGHVIGLGDRHSENILVDEACGEMVHVDFDCIFDKGLNLPKPEVVPFRLTANMVDAFGPVGADGIYTSSLKDAMSTLRSNRDTLLSVLEPFIKDPVIDWKRTRTQQKSQTEPSERKSDRHVKEAKRSIKVIDERLQGVYNLKNPNHKRVRRTDLRSAPSEMDVMANMLPLTVDGQVHKMISEATSSENLVQLYVGWMPWV